MDYNMTDSTNKINGRADNIDAFATQQLSDLSQKLMGELNFSRSKGASGKETVGATMPIENEGAISSATLDKEWQKGNSENSGFRRLSNFHANGYDSATISIVQPAASLNREAASAFHQVLQQYAHEKHNLSPDEIRSLEGVMGRINTGDNQYTNSAAGEDRYAPVFHIDNCRIQQIADKAVLIVEGNFVNSDGSAGKNLKGVLIDRDGTGTKIQGLTFEASDRSKYDAHVNSFDKMLKSIKWEK